MVSHGRVVWLRAGGELGAAYRAVPYTGVCCSTPRGNGVRPKKGRFRLGIMFTVRLVRHCSGSPRSGVAPSCRHPRSGDGI